MNAVNREVFDKQTKSISQAGKNSCANIILLSHGDANGTLSLG
jgi:hypothetical protein